jgi:hypothetical protein
MSDDLLRQLRVLEEEYAGQPPVVQQADLRTINQLRSRLGMPPVDARLKEAGAAEGAAKPEPAKAAPEEGPDHTEAREVYRAYLKKEEELEAHRAYAEQVVRATAGRGQTPVRPLATLGTGGGPLLCDRCRKPMVLEGGPSHGAAADQAWRRSPRDGWTSWILGGMVVEVQTNGTLRIYHGYPGRNDRQCCNAARREDERARAEFGPGKGGEKQGMILAFLEHEFPDLGPAERLGLLSKMLDAMYSYDPGVGVNRPGGSD